VTPGQRAHGRVELLAERIEAGEVNRDGSEVDRLAREIAPDVGDNSRDRRRRLGGAGACGLGGKAPFGGGAILLRQLHAGEATVIPCHPARPDRGAEDVVVR
jgi:hypothetical protein